MERKMLASSAVVFNEEHHTYDLNGKMLSGVTPIISWLFPDTYKGIPQSVLDKAAEYGTDVHKACEVYDTLEVLPFEDELADVVRQYASVTKELDNVLCSEYLVSDGERIASAIDKVFEDDSLGDIKTTSKVHTRNVQVQLSIYAWLYEKMNPERKVPHLYLIWLPKPQYGKPMVKELERIPASVCEYIVEVWAANGEPMSALSAIAGCGITLEQEKQRVEGEVPDAVQPLVDELVMVKKQLDILSEREKEIKQALLDTMTLSNEDKWYNDIIQISKRAESTRVSVDSAKLKKDFPEAFVECQKVSKVAASLTYKVL